MSEPLRKITEFYYSSDGVLIDKIGTSKFNAQDNYINFIVVYLEDGVAKNETNLINFTPKTNSTFTSHWFYLSPMGIVEKTMNGETQPRVFGVYGIEVPKPILSVYNGKNEVEVDVTIVKRYGSNFIGNFKDLSTLNSTYTQQEMSEFYHNLSFAYVYGDGLNNGLYQVDSLSGSFYWELKTESFTGSMTQKQYNSTTIYIGKGFTNPNPIQPSIGQTLFNSIMLVLNNVQNDVIRLEQMILDIIEVGTLIDDVTIVKNNEGEIMVSPDLKIDGGFL